jgi:cytochrome d ubiquinol oxidase subunit I
VYGLIRTSEGYSKHVGAGTSLFSLLGFLGMYTVLSILWVMLVYNIIEQGPHSTTELAAGQTLTNA